jgi:3-hydroxymyristoyl/3-hydroxydecanoyl-(acyl carrier protein) dehydratase
MRAIKVSDIWEFAPHRPPMVWVDEVLEYSASAGLTKLTLQGEGHYFGEGRRLRSSSCIEFIAQSYGFISVCYRHVKGDPVNQTPKRSYLASFKNVKFGSRDLFNSVRPGDVLLIRVSGVRLMGQIILFSGRVTRGDDVLCEGQMRVFSD